MHFINTFVAFEMIKIFISKLRNSAIHLRNLYYAKNVGLFQTICKHDSQDLEILLSSPCVTP